MHAPALGQIMDSIDLQKLQALFDEAVELPADERSAFLDAHCDNQALRGEVEALLVAAETGSVAIKNAQRIAAPENR